MTASRRGPGRMRTRLRARAAAASALFLVLAAAPAPAPAQHPVLERILAAPFPSDLVAAPTGGHVAWVGNDRGRRNLWVASPPEYRGRQVTSHGDDDGQAIGSLAWTPDARQLVYVRGGAPNRAGEIPNPASDPAGAEQALWRVAVAPPAAAAGDAAPVRIGPGSGPAVSPRGDRVAFVRGGAIWWAPLDGSGEAERLVQVRGGAGSLRWSPDGARLAFVSGRGTHSFVGVYDVAARAVRWLDPSVDRDGSPAWSPDGTRVAFIRIPASSRLTIFRAVREAEVPWSIRVADAATGAGREAWRAEPGRGSAFQGVAAPDQLLWGEGDRIVFPWERTGWLSLYSVPAGGGDATLLTPGEFEAEHVTLSADRRDVVYSSNQGDSDRRGIWRVPVAGGAAPVPLTRGVEIAWAPAPTSDGRALAFLRSGARTPATPAIRVGDVVRDLVPGWVPADFPAAALVEPRAVSFPAADGMTIPAQLFLPAELRPGERRPAVVFFHGGSRRQMLLGFHYSPYYHNAYALNQYLAARGFVVLSVNFRSGTGYGLAFREALDYGAAGASEYHDVVGAAHYLRGRPDVDPARIAAWGGSYGGYLTAMALARNSDLYAAGVDIHGVHDWNVGIRTFIPSYNTLELPEEARVAFQASPLASIDSWRSPVLLIHGDDDRNVAFAETVTLVQALRRRGVEHEVLVFPDEVHSFLRHENWVRAFTAAAAFLERRLGGR
jgi:dipeptidyl aminopeptidase/acylaminoacyl peptidase